MANEIQIDAFPPAKMASRMESVGVAKAELRTNTMFALAVLAGAFIGCGAIFATVVTTGLGAVGMGFGVIKLLGGLVFCLGLVGVVVAGAELFTGNNLIIMAFASGRVSLAKLLRNWGIVYAGNFVGSILTAMIMLATKQYMFSNGSLGANALGIANAKTGLGFFQAIALGIMCNALVCLAVWLCSSARSTTDKILAIIFPITAFVAAGFEHSVANMYFIPIGLFIKSTAGAGFWDAIGRTAADYGNLTWGAFFIKNLLPVTIGNIIGGAGFVGLVYWFIYLRPQKVVEVAKEAAVQILVVDDDPDMIEFTRNVLTKDGGYEVVSAANGAQALEIMKAEPPDLVLLDVMMDSPLDGVNLARKMTMDIILSEIPVIMVSSIEHSEYADRLPDDMRIPIDAWISKPVDPDHLLRTVRRFLA
ncbi:MAG TPA: formate/nitrite family transporter [Anaerolineales bacterium]|nr:formate/nitrite family transporter [Anaerolineales bacterium]HUS84538.1 formate/nitrite family transporter [Anaerolineales bacterium]